MLFPTMHFYHVVQFPQGKVFACEVNNAEVLNKICLLKKHGYQDLRTSVVHSINGKIDSVDALVNTQGPCLKLTSVFRRLLVQSLAQPILFLSIDDSHCNRIHSSLNAVHYFNNGYVGKQSVALKDYCEEYW